MNPEVKKKWLEALRSGRYEQGKETLRFKDKFCCLGVLCDLHSKEEKKEWIDDVTKMCYLGAYSVPPGEVLIWAGLNNANPFIESRGKAIAVINDNGATFTEIADLIEKEL